MAWEFNETILNELEEYIVAFQRNYRRAPTIREILSDLSVHFKKSSSKCQRYLKALTDSGRISYTRGEGVDCNPLVISGETQSVSLVGDCPCGTPITAIENIEGTYELPVELFGAEEHFMLRAKGESMIGCGIFDGDIMVVKKQETAHSGEIVIALIGDTATAKIFFPGKKFVTLRAANDDTYTDGSPIYPDIITRQCQILGIVDTVIHHPVKKKRHSF